MPEITIAGVGPGDFSKITLEVIEEIKNSDCILTAKSHENLIPKGKKIIELHNFEESFKKIEKESGKVLILVSGDPCLYSLMTIVKKRFPNEKIKILNGISSLQTLCAISGESWQEAVILSGHGRNLSKIKFLNAVERNKLVILFCDKNISPNWVCDVLKDFDERIEVIIGINLTKNNEKINILKFPFKDKVNLCDDDVAIVLVKNSNPLVFPERRVRDKNIERDKKIPMTNEIVRSVILDRLNLNNNSIFWDIGFGSGSISLNAAIENPECEIHSIDFNHEAISLILKNIKKFHVHNINIHEINAKNIIKYLPEPTHIFIGGSNGELNEIFSFIKNLKKRPVKILMSCVTLENLSDGIKFFKSLENFEAVQIFASESKNLSENSLTLMSAHNPITILSASL